MAHTQDASRSCLPDRGRCLAWNQEAISECTEQDFFELGDDDSPQIGAFQSYYTSSALIQKVVDNNNHLIIFYNLDLISECSVFGFQALRYHV